MAIIYFPRTPIDRPSTRIKSDTSGLTGSSSGSQKTVMLIGSAQGGKPDAVYKVRSMYQARQIFRGGELLEAMEMAWNPSNGSVGAGDILAMRAEDAKPAELKKGGVTFRSKLYGEEANQVEVELTTNDLGENPSRSLVVTFAPDGYRRVYRNIGHILTLEKTSDGPAYASYKIENDRLTVSVGDSVDEAQEVSFALGVGQYTQATNLSNAINNIPGIRATMPIGGNKNINTAGLDPVSETEIDGPTKVTGLLADIVHQLRYDEVLEVGVDESNLLQSKDTDEVIVTGGVEIEDFPTEQLSGGETGTIPDSWAEKFDKFANEGGYYIVPLTDSQAIHAEVTEFVNDRNLNAEPMRAIVGAGYDESGEQLLSRAASIRNSRTMLVGFSGRTPLADGRSKQTPGYMHAAQVAGVASSLPIGEAVTFKDVGLTQLSRIFSSSEMDELNGGGVVMAEFVRDRTRTKFRIVDDVTTYNNQDDPVSNQMGVGEAHDFLVSELKVALDENFIGKRVVNISSALLKNFIQSFLDQKKRDNEIQDYNPEDVQVSIDGELANISMVVYPIRSLKRIEVVLEYRQQVLSS